MVIITLSEYEKPNWKVLLPPTFARRHFQTNKIEGFTEFIKLQEQIGAHQHLSLQNSKQVASSYQSKIKEKHKNKSFEGVTHKMRH
jgi:hypothetical protein